MSIDVLQDKIRKKKNPSLIQLEAFPELIPESVLADNGSLAAACKAYYCALLEGLKNTVPAVRIDRGSFSLLGVEGLTAFACIARTAKDLGYYVITDLPQLLSPGAAKNAALCLVEDDCFDGYVAGAYLGSDVLRHLVQLCKSGKSLFAVVRTSNKSAVELQDLLTGGRLVHTAAADVVYRHGETLGGKFGYSQLAAMAAAGSVDSLRTLRSRYAKLFLLVDGYDYPNGNAKNCSHAFDRFGHGAVVCAGASITAAWKEAEGECAYVEAALAAAEKMKKNLVRYVNIL